MFLRIPHAAPAQMPLHAYRRHDAQGRMTALQVATAYRMELGTEALRHARMPGFVLPALLFPLMSYALIAGLMPDGHDKRSDLLVLANHVSFAAIAPGLFAFGVSHAQERENGFLLLKQALPVPNHAYRAAKLAVAMLMAALSVLLLVVVVRLTGHEAAPLAAVRLMVVAALGTPLFCALGLLVGSFVSGRGATGLMMLLLVPLGFFSGLLVPAPLLPPALRAVAMGTPGYDLSILAIDATTAHFAAALRPGCTLVSFTILLGALAWWRLRKTVLF
jgi:ABC-2 type transport system permease protein